jgi:signal transduction histidine kinase
MDLYFLIKIGVGVLASFVFAHTSLSYKYKRKYATAKSRMEKDAQMGLEKMIFEVKLEVQEQTFRQISEELHDNINQLLSLANIQLSAVEGRALPEDQNLIREARYNVSFAMQSLRSLARSLHSGWIRQLTIGTAIQFELERIQKASRIICEFTETGKPYPFAKDKELILFRIFQEAVQNTIKHAQALRLSVSLNYDLDNINLSIQDDGRGFQVSDELPNAGIGLTNIGARTKLMGGKMTLFSRPGEGTKINIDIPVENSIYETDNS